VKLALGLAPPVAVWGGPVGAWSPIRLTSIAWASRGSKSQKSWMGICVEQGATAVGMDPGWVGLARQCWQHACGNTMWVRMCSTLHVMARALACQNWRPP
jgi:hypothetical protein